MKTNFFKQNCQNIYDILTDTTRFESQHKSRLYFAFFGNPTNTFIKVTALLFTLMGSMFIMMGLDKLGLIDPDDIGLLLSVIGSIVILWVLVVFLLSYSDFRYFGYKKFLKYYSFGSFNFPVELSFTNCQRKSLYFGRRVEDYDEPQGKKEFVTQTLNTYSRATVIQDGYKYHMILVPSLRNSDKCVKSEIIEDVSFEGEMEANNNDIHKIVVEVFSKGEKFTTMTAKTGTFNSMTIKKKLMNLQHRIETSAIDYDLAVVKNGENMVDKTMFSKSLRLG